MMIEQVLDEEGFYLPTKSVETLEEGVREIKAAVEEIAQTLYKGNGHSLLARIALLESQSNATMEEVERVRVMLHDVKNRLVVAELKDTQLERRAEKGDNKVWEVVKILVALAIGALFTFAISGKLVG